MNRNIILRGSMSSKLIYSALAALTITACTSEQVEEVKETLAGSGSNLGADVSVTRNADGTIDITTSSGSVKGMVVNPRFGTAFDDTKFDLYRRPSTNSANSRNTEEPPYYGVIYGRTESVEAGLVETTLFTETGTTEVGMVFRRLVDTELPTEGTAIYSGKYVGFSGVGTEGGPQLPIAAIKGDVGLNVDFAAESVGGSITERLLVYTVDRDTGETRFGGPLQDVTLNTAVLNSNGTFTGTATGGTVTSLAEDTNIEILTPTSGTYAGILGGATGNEAVGGVQLTTIYKRVNGDPQDPNLSRIESGLFHADQQQ